MRKKLIAAAALAGTLALVGTSAMSASADTSFYYGAMNCGTGTYPNGLYPTSTSTAKTHALHQIGVGGSYLSKEWYDAAYTPRQYATASHTVNWVTITLNQWTTQSAICGYL
jgi:hypothetical protein